MESADTKPFRERAWVFADRILPEVVDSLGDRDGQAGSSFQRHPAGVHAFYPDSRPRGLRLPTQGACTASGSGDSPAAACSGSLSLSGRRDCSPIQSGLVHIYPDPNIGEIVQAGPPGPPPVRKMQGQAVQ